MDLESALLFLSYTPIDIFAIVLLVAICVPLGVALYTLFTMEEYK